MQCPNPPWEKDEHGYYVWSATNGNKCYIHEYVKELEEEIEVLKMTVQHYKTGGNVKF